MVSVSTVFLKFRRAEQGDAMTENQWLWIAKAPKLESVVTSDCSLPAQG